MFKKEITKGKFIWFSALTVGVMVFLAGFLYIISVISIDASSTASLILIPGILFSLILGLIIGVVGAGIGWIISLIIITPSKHTIKKKKVMISLIILFVITFIPTFYLYNFYVDVDEKLTAEYEDVNEIGFGIKKNSNLVNRVYSYGGQLTQEGFILNSERYLFEGDQNKTFTWEGKEYNLKLIGKDPNIVVIDSEENYLINYELGSNYPYILNLSFIPYGPYLTVLAVFDENYHSSIFLIFNKKGEIIYEELLGDFNIIGIAMKDNEKDAIIIAKGPIIDYDKTILYAYQIS